MKIVTYSAAQRSALHLFEPERQHTMMLAALDGILGQVQGGRSGRAVVVHVHNRNTGQTQLVHGSLATGRITLKQNNLEKRVVFFLRAKVIN
jgi:hypothetical protein